MKMRYLAFMVLLLCSFFCSCTGNNEKPVVSSTTDMKNKKLNEITVKKSTIYYTDNINTDDLNRIVSFLDSAFFLDDPGQTMKIDQEDGSIQIYVVTARVVIESGVFAEEHYLLLADLMKEQIFEDKVDIVFYVCDSNYNIVKEVKAEELARQEE